MRRSAVAVVCVVAVVAMGAAVFFALSGAGAAMFAALRTTVPHPESPRPTDGTSGDPGAPGAPRRGPGAAAENPSRDAPTAPIPGAIRGLVRAAAGAVAAPPAPAATTEPAVSAGGDFATRAIPGASVELRRRDADGRIVIVARVACAADGTFVLPPAPPASGDARVRRDGGEEVRASAPGFVAVTRRVSGTESLVFDLAPGVPVEGRVLTAEDALVRVNPAAREAPYDFVVSAADGSYRFDGVPAGRAYLSAYPRGRASVEVAIDVRSVGVASGVRQDLFVAAGTTLTGVVRFRGRPVADAVVRDEECVSTTTASDGTYRIDGLAPGTRVLVIEAPGFEPLAEKAEMPRGLATLRFDIDLVPAWIVRGRVVAADRPIAGVRVARSQQDFDDFDALVVTSGPDGAFEMRGAWPPPGGLVARGAGGEAGAADVPDLAEPSGAATTATAEGVVVTIEARALVKVVVVDVPGRPVPGAEVVAGPGILVPREDEFPEERGVTSDKGECEVALARGDWRITARRDGYFAETAKCENSGEMFGPGVVRIVMRPGGDASGRVVDPDGAPVAGVDLWAWGDQLNWRTTTGADGRWTLRGLPDDDVRARIARDGYVPSSAHSIRPAEPKDLVLDPESVIEGVVTMPDGATPARSFTVRLFFMADRKGEPWRNPWWPFQTDTVCDAHGRFVLRGIQPGMIDVEASAGALVSPKRERVVLGRDSRRARVAIRLAPGARISGRVSDGSGNAIAGASVSGGVVTYDDDSDTGDHWTWTDADGRWEFGGLPPGRYLVEVGGVSRIDGADLNDVQANLVVPLAAGESVVRDVTLRRPGFLEVRIVDADGAEVEEDVDWSLTDADGAKASGGGEWPLQPGAYTLHASCEGYEDATLSVRVEEGKTTSVTVTLRR